MRRRLMLKNTAVSLNNFAPKAPTAAPGSSTGTYAVLDDGTWSFTETIAKWNPMPFYLKTPIPINSGDVIKLTVVNSGISRQGRVIMRGSNDWSNRLTPNSGVVFTITATTSINLEGFDWEFNVDLTQNGTMKFSLSINDSVVF